MIQPKTGRPCACRPGIERDNCPQCEGTGQQIDFKAVRDHYGMVARAALFDDLVAALRRLRGCYGVREGETWNGDTESAAEQADAVLARADTLRDPECPYRKQAEAGGKECQCDACVARRRVRL